MSHDSDPEIEAMIAAALRGETVTKKVRDVPPPLTPKDWLPAWALAAEEAAQSVELPMSEAELAELRPEPIPMRAWRRIESSGERLATSGAHRHLEVGRQMDELVRHARTETRMHVLLRYQHELDELAQTYRDLEFVLGAWFAARNPPAPAKPKAVPTESSEAPTSADSGSGGKG
jgi:hypothetical protein